MSRRSFRPSKETLARLEKVARARQGHAAEKLNLTAALNSCIFLAEAMLAAEAGGCLDRLAAHLTIARRKVVSNADAAAFALHHVESLILTGKLTQNDLAAKKGVA